MSVLDLTLPASYAKVPFLVKGAPTTGGVKTVKHVFPNSSNQVIENLGQLQNTFNVQAWITNDSTQDNYITKRDTLIAALNKGVREVLVHPLFGIVDNVIATTWSLSEDFTDLGVATFNITFEIDLPQSVPQVAANTFSQVESTQSIATTSITADVAGSYDIQFFNNVSDAIAQVDGFVDALVENTEIFSINVDQLNTFNSQVSDLTANIATLVRTPQALADSVNNLFETMSGMYTTVDATFDVLKQFFNFGDDDIEIVGSTASKIERKKNRELFNNSIQSYALVHAYTQASQLDFATVDDQQEVSAELEAQFDKVSANVVIPTLATFFDTDKTLPPSYIELGLSTDTKADINDQRIAVQNLFDDNSVTLGRIITILTPLTTARALAYQYYGSSELGEDIARLNNITDPAFVEGEVRIITS